MNEIWKQKYQELESKYFVNTKDMTMKIKQLEEELAVYQQTSSTQQ